MIEASVADRIWSAIEPTVFISREEFFKNLEGWKVSPVWVDGEMAFVTLTNGPAFHFQSFGTRHRISPRMIRGFLQKIINVHGYATTKTPKEDVRQHRFNLAFGFRVTGEDGFDVHYRIDKLKGATCQS